MDEKFKKHYLTVVRTVETQGKIIQELQGVATELQLEVSKLKSDMITHGMSPEDKEQFQRVFQSDEETNKINPAPPETEDPKQPTEGVQETFGC